ncbi:PREDICTED: 10 kDa chaperonin [Prunus dulcis]|uniref:PREDICTED: 10 kDa chaperonin n=1 Tax=Prunus dulcis TaxID=3755 RepID=A0A5E4FNS4_PRUDU|nr:10 kDa chaperonin 1, chloroplastic-like [Prunus dulcis]VVA29118.1 PREDICTED: 10 kDa chaperonin [Prunus dulcis]
MASTFVTLPNPLLCKPNTASLSNQKLLPGLRRNSLRINAVSKKWEPTKVVPQADRVLIRLEELPEKSAGGVLLPKSAVKFERYLMGEILSVGVEVGEVKAGKKVLFSDINAYEVDLGTDGRHCFCKESELLAVVE